MAVKNISFVLEQG